MTDSKRNSDILTPDYDAFHDAFDIAIVGIGSTLPNAKTPNELWTMLLNRQHAAAPIPDHRWPVLPESILKPDAPAPDKTRSVYACLLNSIPTFPTRISGLPEPYDPLFDLTLHTGHTCFKDIRGSFPDRKRSGVILGNIILPTDTASDIASALALPAIRHQVTGIMPEHDANYAPAENLYPSALPAILLAKTLNFQGCAFTIDAACASSLYALKLAAHELISGRLDLVLSGGVSRPDCMYTQMGFSQLQALSPSGICSPFDQNADGLVVGEGAAIVALKRLKDAIRDDDHIYGIIRAVGISNDIGGSVFGPDTEGQVRAMQKAYRQTDWNPAEIDLIECHGTGTPVGDAVEFTSLSTVWNATETKRNQCVIGSVKSNIGHLLTAAGGAGLIKTLMAIHHRILPATANFSQPSRRIPLAESPFTILTTPQSWDTDNSKPRRAAVSAFGFGGINAHLLIEEWKPVKNRQHNTPASPEKNPASSIVHDDHAATSRPAPKIAIVGIAAAAGPWTDIEMLQQRLAGTETASAFTNTGNHTWFWNGLDRSEWFKRNAVHPDHRTGYVMKNAALSPVRFRIPPAELRDMLPQQLLMLKVAADAVDQGAWNQSDAMESGVFIGVGLDPGTTNFCVRWRLEKQVPEWFQGSICPEDTVNTVKNTWSPPLTANRTMGALGGMVAARVARALKVGGAGFTVSADELSGTAALSVAVRMLQQGDIRQALAGAVDFNCDWRAALGSTIRNPHNNDTALTDGAVAFVLKRLEDAETAGDTVLAIIDDIGLSAHSPSAIPLNSVSGDETVLCNRNTHPFIGDTGAVSGICDITRAVIALHHRVLPGNAVDCVTESQYWLRNRENGSRKACVISASFSGLHSVVSLSEHEPSSQKPLALPQLTGPITGIAAEYDFSLRNTPAPKTAFVYPGSGNHRPFLGRELSFHFRHVMDELDRDNLRLKDMFQPHIYWNQPNRAKMDTNPRALIIGHVTYGYFITELIRRTGIKPEAVIGYSLGESTGLMAWNVWPDRDRLLRQLQASSLFVDDLAGACRVLETAWDLPEGIPPEWRIAIVNCDPDTVRTHLKQYRYLYLLIINTREQCVVGGHGPELETFLKTAGLSGVEVTGVTVAHIPEVSQVAGAYRELHYQPVSVPENMAFYSGAWGKQYPVSSSTCADAILAHACNEINFVTTIEAAFRDGVRYFIEPGPGNGCTGMIRHILEGRDYTVDLMDQRGQTPSGTLLSLLSRMAANGHVVHIESLITGQPSSWKKPDAASPGDIPCNPSPDTDYDYAVACRQIHTPNAPATADSPSLQDSTKPDALLSRALDRTASAVRAAHEQYLELSRHWTESMRRLMTFQTDLLPLLGPVAGTTKQLAWPVAASRDIFLDRQRCLEFAIGSIADVLGQEFAEADTFPTRVRLPDEPLMLVDRILDVIAKPRSMTPGRIVTEHDVRPGAWYLDQGKCPVCITVEAGQADLFLSGYLGIDYETKGIQKYRLLDAEITMYRGLPEPGDTIRYDIRITRFFRQNNIWLFQFEYDASIADEPLMRMRNGTAGFFSDDELAAGQGIIRPAIQDQPEQLNRNTGDVAFVPVTGATFDASQLNALREGRLFDCFGKPFDALALKQPAGLPGGKMHLIDRIVLFEPYGGPCKSGRIRAEADIDPEAWFLTCHFIDDMVMPGTLMYECCFHTFRVFLMRMGWVGEHDEFCWDPMPGITSRLKCRGQVIPSTRMAAYEVTVRDIGFDPVPYAVADAMMYADDRPVVEIRNMSVRLTGLTRERLENLWSAASHEPSDQFSPEVSITAGSITGPKPGTLPALFDSSRILAFSNGKPSDAFGDRYAVFDTERVIARLPGPPCQFLHRVVIIEAEQWKMKAGGRIVTEYDIQDTEWYLTANGPSGMPFAVLLEIALQPCGWFSAYMGSALHSDTNLSYRNLGGNGVVHRLPLSGDRTLAVDVTCTGISHSGGMIIQNFDFLVYDRDGIVYSGDTYFGFFTKAALADQIGIRDHKPFETVRDNQSPLRAFPENSLLPKPPLRMMDTITMLETAGEPFGYGMVEGLKTIDENEWFFSAHFYQDPVWPGSLGIEAMLQLLQVYAVERWGNTFRRFEYTSRQHQWIYRGQVLPSNRRVTVQAVVTHANDTQKTVQADGYLIVDGKLIYSMKQFELNAVSD